MDYNIYEMFGKNFSFIIDYFSISWRQTVALSSICTNLTSGAEKLSQNGVILYCFARAQKINFVGPKNKKSKILNLFSNPLPYPPLEKTAKWAKFVDTRSSIYSIVSTGGLKKKTIFSRDW